MEQPKRVYIALGSNLSDKFKNLQLALDAIHQKLGSIEKISKVFSSPAIGFDGDDFFNACVIVRTYQKPSQVMKTLLSIEKNLGRDRSKRDINRVL